MKEGTNRNRMRMLLALAGYLKKYRFKTLITILSGILKEGFSLLALGISSYLVALVLTGSLEQGKGEQLLGLLTLSVICFSLFRYLESYLSHDVAFHILVDLRVLLYRAFEGQCPAILLKKKGGQLSATLMNDVEILEWFFGHTAGSLVITAVIVTGMLGFLLWLHPWLFVAMLFHILLITAIPLLFKNTADRQGLINRFKLGEANAVTLEGLNGLPEMLSLNYAGRYQEKNTRFMRQLAASQVAYSKRQGLEKGLLLAAVGLAAMGMNLLAAALTLRGALPLKWYAVVGGSVWFAFTPLLTLCQQAGSFGMIFAAAARVFELLHEKPLVSDRGRDLPEQEIGSDISFEQVDFQYEGATAPALQGVSFTVAPGEMVALVGASGAGKTTCLHLLLRLWEVKQGTIRIGGRDIRSLSLDTLRRLTTGVLQESYLFNRSILDNIRLGSPQTTEEEIREAARQARIHDFIMSLPQGYHTLVGERGTQLSGGQRQRIAIARALLKKTPILLFDEAVSNLDTDSEREIQAVLRQLSASRTIILVAHRLSTITTADRLIVFQAGQVVQTGTPSELAAREGPYRQLIESQL